MADQKISELVAKTTLHDTDLVPIVDIEATPDETKKITGANLRAGIKTIKDADADTKIQVEEGADEDKIRMDVKGVESFLLSDIGVLTLAKQSSAKANRATSVQEIPDQSWTHLSLNAEVSDIQSEMDVSVKSGTADATQANKLHDADGGFASGDVGATIWNKTDNTYTTVSAFVDSGELTLTDDIMVNGETYDLYFARFTAKEAGLYLAVGKADFYNPVADKRVGVAVFKNGAEAALAFAHTSIPVYRSAGPALDLLSLSANDYLDLRVWHNCGVVEAIYYGVGNTYLSIAKIA